MITIKFKGILLPKYEKMYTALIEFTHASNTSMLLAFLYYIFSFHVMYTK